MAAPSINYRPDRNVLVAMIGGALASQLIAWGKKWFGADFLTPEMLTLLPVLITGGIAYTVAPSKDDVAARTTNETVRRANADPNNKTTAMIVTAEQSEQAAAIDAQAGLVDPPPATAQDKVKDGG